MIEEKIQGNKLEGMFIPTSSLYTEEQKNVYKAIEKMTDVITKIDPNLKKEIQSLKSGTGLRYNDGKLRYDLFHPYSMEQLAKIFTMGANKYAERNWEKGMKWTTVIASLKRHLAAIERGEDYDKESGLLHSSHVEWNAHALTAYYKIFPQGDDRPKAFLNNFKVGLDIDGILANFTGGIIDECDEKHKEHIPFSWADPIIVSKFHAVRENKEFWLNLKPLISGKEMPFEPSCYITARSIDKEVTQAWLDKHHFPNAPLYCVGPNESKVNTALKAGINLFIDDHYGNFVDMNKAGIFTLLYTAPYNKKYEVGHMRVDSLQEFKERYLQ